ncbi:MAG: flagellar type III secretion system pore protein FliP [Chthoniobacteraceae bacterium]
MTGAFRGGQRWLGWLVVCVALWLVLPHAAHAQGFGFGASAGGTPAGGSGGSPALQLNVGLNDQKSVSGAIQVLVLMTILTLAPSIVFLMTSFTRIVIVLGFLRNALGVQNAPSNQIIIGLSLFLTMFIMAPVWTQVQTTALDPYMAGRMTAQDAAARAEVPLKQFMLKQTRTSEIEFFLSLSHSGPMSVADLPITVVVPAFVVSELRTAFQMGLMLFIPFLVIDFLVSATLMSMGMMMMPPTVVSLPFKLLLFVLVDGWHLVIQSLVQSFGV